MAQFKRGNVYNAQAVVAATPMVNNTIAVDGARDAMCLVTVCNQDGTLDLQINLDGTWRTMAGATYATTANVPFALEIGINQEIRPSFTPVANGVLYMRLTPKSARPEG